MELPDFALENSSGWRVSLPKRAGVVQSRLLVNRRDGRECQRLRKWVCDVEWLSTENVRFAAGEHRKSKYTRQDEYA